MPEALSVKNSALPWNLKCNHTEEKIKQIHILVKEMMKMILQTEYVWKTV